MQVSRFIKIYTAPDDTDRVLIYSTLRGAVLQVSRSVSEALLDGTLEGQERETMARLGILVPDALAEQRQVAGYFDWANANVRRFTALVTRLKENFVPAALAALRSGPAMRRMSGIESSASPP